MAHPAPYPVLPKLISPGVKQLVQDLTKHPHLLCSDASKLTTYKSLLPGIILYTADPNKAFS